MKKNLMITFLAAACCAAPCAAQDSLPVDPRIIGGGSFSDPAFQDFIETSDGYLNSKNTMKVVTDFSGYRDAPISAVPTLRNPVPAVKAAPAVPKREMPLLPAGHYKVTFAGESGPVGSFVWPLGGVPGKYAREYVFMSVTPADKDYARLLARLEAEGGFRFVGEKTFYSRSSRRTVLLGWAPAANLVKISRVKGVLKAATEKQSAGVPLKTKVRFTLKVPYQNHPNKFVPGFIKGLTDSHGFAAETWFRRPWKGADSKFSVFDVTGTLPVDMIGELSRSPFVASIEFHDASL
ncbi:MAG TPA: hypothetical protein DCS63_06685 [Elusimicrobia bacterium]|nr:hypothetical protein [Elusimicrobiota bacterium]